MEYKKIIKQNYNIHIINTKRFKTVSLNVTFSNKFNKLDIPYLNLLAKNLISSTKKYKTSSELAILGEELYGSSISTSFNIIGNIERIMLSLDFLNPKYTEDNMIKESILFLKECMFNPNIKDNAFDEHYYNINKNNIVNSLKSIKDNAYSYAFIKFKNEMYKGSPLSYNLFNNIPVIESIDNKDLYSFYLKVIKTFKIDVFLIGNIESEEEYVKYLDKMFLNCGNEFNKKLIINNELEDSNKRKISEKREFSQSQLFIGYVFKDLTEYEKKYVLSYYNGILGGINNSLLFTEVRENNSLCYSIDSFITSNPYSLVVETEIDKNNVDKAINIIDKLLKQMSDKKIIEPLFNTTKEYINTSLNSFYDNIGIIIDYYYKSEFEKTDDIETRRKKYNEVTIEDVIKLNNKIKKSVTYLLEGDTNEKDSIQ